MEELIKERLDRSLGRVEWIQTFEKAKCLHIEKEASDHCALPLDTNPVKIHKKGRFLFDKRWLAKKGINSIIQKAWNKEFNGSRIYNRTQKIKSCKQELI